MGYIAISIGESVPERTASALLRRAGGALQDETVFRHSCGRNHLLMSATSSPAVAVQRSVDAIMLRIGATASIDRPEEIVAPGADVVCSSEGVAATTDTLGMFQLAVRRRDGWAAVGDSASAL